MICGARGVQRRDEQRDGFVQGWEKGPGEQPNGLSLSITAAQGALHLYYSMMGSGQRLSVCLLLRVRSAVPVPRCAEALCHQLPSPRVTAILQPSPCSHHPPTLTHGSPCMGHTEPFLCFWQQAEPAPGPVGQQRWSPEREGLGKVPGPGRVPLTRRRATAPQTQRRDRGHGQPEGLPPARCRRPPPPHH